MPQPTNQKGGLKWTFLRWRKEEEELFAHDLEGCMKLFEEKSQSSEQEATQKTKIEVTKQRLFPLKNDVEEARAMVEAVPDARTQHVGDDLDPENEKENEDQADEGLKDSEEYAGRDPGELAKSEERLRGSCEKIPYRKVDISNYTYLQEHLCVVT